MSTSRKRRRHTAKSRKLMSKAKMGTKLPPETKAKISATMKNRPKTEEHRRNMSIGRTGKPHPPVRKGMKHTPEAKAKIAASLRKHWSQVRKQQEVSEGELDVEKV